MLVSFCFDPINDIFIPKNWCDFFLICIFIFYIFACVGCPERGRLYWHDLVPRYHLCWQMQMWLGTRYWPNVGIWNCNAKENLSCRMLLRLIWFFFFLPSGTDCFSVYLKEIQTFLTWIRYSLKEFPIRWPLIRYLFMAYFLLLFGFCFVLFFTSLVKLWIVSLLAKVWSCPRFLRVNRSHYGVFFFSGRWNIDLWRLP